MLNVSGQNQETGAESSPAVMSRRHFLSRTAALTSGAVIGLTGLSGILEACGSVAPSSTSSGRQPGTTSAKALVPVRFSMNPAFYSYLPLFVSLDKGYFKHAGIDIHLTTYHTSAGTQIPLLAKGHLDITSVICGPSLYNQFHSGFDSKLVAALSGSKAGWHDTTQVVVRQDLWASGAIREPKDLRGKRFDGAFLGSPDDFISEELIKKAGLTLSDLTYTTKEASPADQLAALKNKAVDVQTTTEPTATEMQLKGVGHRWMDTLEIAPWYQSTYIAVSAPFLKSHPDAVSKFLVGMLRGVQDVAKTDGKWTPELLTIASKWSGIPPSVFRKIGGMPYSVADGHLDKTALSRVQDLWVSRGLVKHPVTIDQMIDPTPLTLAQQQLHLA